MSWRKVGLLIALAATFSTALVLVLNDSSARRNPVGSVSPRPSPQSSPNQPAGIPPGWPSEPNVADLPLTLHEETLQDPGEQLPASTVADIYKSVEENLFLMEHPANPSDRHELYFGLWTTNSHVPHRLRQPEPEIETVKAWWLVTYEIHCIGSGGPITMESPRKPRSPLLCTGVFYVLDDGPRLVGSITFG